MPKVRFTYSRARCDRRHYVGEADVSVVLGRLPEEDWDGLRAVHLRERLAQEFADGWRRRLWAERFEHPDPAHNPPSARELNLSRLLKLSESSRA